MASTQQIFNWWEIKNNDWSFTQPLKMPPLGDRIAVVMGQEQETGLVVKNPQLQRLQMLLDSPKGQKSATDILMESKPKEEAAAPAKETRRREPPKRTASKKENRIAPKKPERIASKKTLIDRRDSDLTPPAEPAPQAPQVVVPQIPKEEPSKPGIREIPDSPPKQEPPKSEQPKSPTKPIVEPQVVPTSPKKVESPSSPSTGPAAGSPAIAAPVGNYPEKNGVVSKLKQLDDLLEDLELDFTDVMLSENWEPIRNIVKQLSESFAD